MKICAYVDFMGSGEMTPEDEYLEIKKWLSRLLKCNFDFETEIHPGSLNNKPVDIFVMDFGGLMPGCDGLMNFVYREFSKQVEDKPNTLFILWSSFTEYWYCEIMGKIANELRDIPNVVFGKDESKIVNWVELWKE